MFLYKFISLLAVGALWYMYERATHLCVVGKVK
jgi:hypothetical protein